MLQQSDSSGQACIALSASVFTDVQAEARNVGKGIAPRLSEPSR
jgi:hypothetical protein